MEYFKIKIATLLFIIISITAISCGSMPTDTTNEKEFVVLEAKQFDERISNEENPQVIDVRTPAEFSEGSMLYAVNYNFLDSTFHKKISALDANRTVYVFCQSGGRSGRAAQLLKEEGFKSVVDLKGGMNAWYKADPVH